MNRWIRQRKGHEYGGGGTNRDPDRLRQTSDERADTVAVVADHDPMDEKQLPGEDRKHGLELRRRQLLRREAVPQVGSPAHRQQWAPPYPAQREETRHGDEHE